MTVQWNIPAKNLEKSLRAYLENGTDAPFDLVTPLPCSRSPLHVPADPQGRRVYSSFWHNSLTPLLQMQPG